MLLIYLQSVKTTDSLLISVMNLLFSLTASKEFELLCYSAWAHGRFRACVWQAFVCHLASF